MRMNTLKNMLTTEIPFEVSYKDGKGERKTRETLKKCDVFLFYTSKTCIFAPILTLKKCNVPLFHTLKKCYCNTLILEDNGYEERIIQRLGALAHF